MKRLLTEFTEALRIAIVQVRANKLRSTLTALGVIIGIISITLMGTAVIGIRSGVQGVLSSIVDNDLVITRIPIKIGSMDWAEMRNRKRIEPKLADLINRWSEEQPWGLIKAATPTVDTWASVGRGDEWVSGVNILGVETDYPKLRNVTLTSGRFFTEEEAERGAEVVVLGYSVAAALFPGESPLGLRVVINRKLYTIVGLLEKKGGWGGGFDKRSIIPLRTYSKSFSHRWGIENIIVSVDMERKGEAWQELRGAVRMARGLSHDQKDDFAINDQEGIMREFDIMVAGIVTSGFFITGLALFVGAIGIMNITYVSVKERTQEIGTRKALGARRRAILLQFLVEAVSICVIGGLIGLGLTFGLTQLAQIFLPGLPVVFSPLLIVGGLLVSIFTGVVSGFAPALQASKLDPVTALRYE